MADDTTGKDREIESLKEERDELRKESKRYRLEKKEAEGKLEEVTGERDKLKARVDGFDAEKAAAMKKAVDDATGPLAKERDALKAKVDATPDEWRAKYEELVGSNRVRDHKEAFRQAAEKAGVNPDAVEDAWDLATAKHGYKAESDAPDEAQIKGTLGAVLKTRAYLLKPAADPPDKSTADPSRNAPDGQTLGTLSASLPGPGIVRGREDTAQPAGTVAKQVEVAFAATGRTHPDRL